MFLFTDGLNEAENLSHQEFGNDRLLKELGRAPFRDAQTTVQAIRSAVADHVGEADASDDLTLLCLKIG